MKNLISYLRKRIADFKCRASWQNETLLREFADNIPGVVYILDLNQSAEPKVSFVSKSMEDLTGLSPEEFYRRDALWMDLILEEDKERYIRGVEDGIAKLEQFIIEYRITHRDGKIIWLLEIGKVVCDSQNEPIRLEGNIFDISKERNLQSALQAINTNKHNDIFFEHVCRCLFEITGMDVIGIAEMKEGESKQALSRALIAGGKFKDAISFDVPESLNRSRDGQEFSCPDSIKTGLMEAGYLSDSRNAIQVVFPLYDSEEKFFGFMFALGKSPLVDYRHIEEVLQVVSTGVARELENERYIHTLEKKINHRAVMLETAHVMLAAREEENRTLLDNLPDGIVTIGTGGIIKTINPAFTKILGYGEEEIFGENVSILMPTDIAKAHDGFIQQYLSTGIKRIIGQPREVEARHKDGRLVSVILTIFEYIVHGESVFTGILKDVSELKKSREVIEDFQKTLDKTLDAIIIANPDTLEIIYANKGVEMLTGYSHAELVNMRVPELRVESSDIKVRRDIQPFIDGKNPQYTFETQYLHKDGHAIAVEVFLQLIVIGRGEKRNIAIIRDITERKKLVTELELAREKAEAGSLAKSQFLATMSHEIRTPMNGIVGMLEVMADGRLSVTQKEQIEVIRESSNSLISLINDILDFSKIEAGELTLEKIAVPVEEIVEGVCLALKNHAATKNVSFSMYIDPDVPDYIFSDKVRLGQIFYNLLGNAIKFSAKDIDADEQGEVTIRVYVSADKPTKLRIDVRDNGIGMSAETIKALFRPFSQADGTITRKYGGTGLGLAVTKSIVDKMAGEIIVQSTPGEGSTMSVILPLEMAGGPLRQENPGLSGISCIMLASKYLNSDDLGSYLKSAGAEVYPVSSKEEVMEKAHRLEGKILLIQHGGRERFSYQLLEEKIIKSPVLGNLFITKGKRRSPRKTEEGVMVLDDGAIPRLTFLKAVAGVFDESAFQQDYVEVELLGGVKDIAAFSGDGISVLVAEDDTINQKVIKAQLERLGLQVTLSDNGIDAFDLMQEKKFDILLTDLHMPDMDGYQLARELRKKEAVGCHMPILALTANAVLGEEVKAFQAGIDDYLTKPISLPMLEASLKKWLQRDVAASPAVSGVGELVTTGEEVLDITILKSLVGDDDEVVGEFLTEYLADIEPLSIRVKAAFAHEDYQEIAYLAHRMKSTSRSVGALALGNVCESLEQHAKTGNRRRLLELIKTFTIAVDAVIAEIKEIHGCKEG